MKVQMVNLLPSFFPNIKKQLIPLHALLLRHFFCQKNQCTSHLPVFLLKMSNRNNMALGNNQKVERGFWLNIVNHKKLFVLVLYFSGKLLLCDFTKNTVPHTRAFSAVFLLLPQETPILR